MRQSEWKGACGLTATQVDPPKMKWCAQCRKSKPVTEFGRSAYYARFGARDGLSIYCRACNRLKAAIRNAKTRAQRAKIAPPRKPVVLAKKKGKKEIQDGSIDAGLLLLSLVTPRGIQLTLEEIAFVCGCSAKLITYYQTKALEKLKHRTSQLEVLREISMNGSEYSYGVSTIYFAA